MRNLLARTRLRASVPGTPVLRGVAVSGMVLVLASAHNPARPGLVPWSAGHRPAASAHAAAGPDRTAAAFRQIILPDLLVVEARPVGREGGPDPEDRRRPERDRLRRRRDQGRPPPGQRDRRQPGPVPVLDAAAHRVRPALLVGAGRRQLRVIRQASARLGLRRGASYQLAGASTRSVRFGMAASLGITGVDLLVNGTVSRQLGLVHRVAALISAPGARLAALTGAVRAVLGSGARIVSLRSQQLPAAPKVSGQLPGSYLSLFRQSAARYCPGMSWTVLAAIGQIESADGTNVGPSTAGALGPMQFMPSTWKEWGITGFGRSGPPDIMNPYDAVPSAARMLCADGAAGGRALYQAVFDYNHADWYVSEVLGLAAEYAKDYP